MRKERSERKTKMIQQLRTRYPRIMIGKKECFAVSGGRIVSIDLFPGEDALVVEYADNYAEAELFRFEDGDRFYLDELSEDEMLTAILQEIEN